MRNLLFAGTLALAMSAMAGQDYYVDAVNGNDLWDGSTATIPTAEQQLLATVPGPRKTLAGAMRISGLTKGDTVHAAPGVYSEGEMYNSCGSNRVIVTAGVLLVGDQGAAKTTIEGKISTDSAAMANGCGVDSLRAVYLNSGAVLKGFTVTKGRSNYPVPGGKNDNGNGAGVSGGTGLAVECVFTNNVSSYRGNAASGATLLRCKIEDDPEGSYALYSGVTLIDCVYDSSRPAYSWSSAYSTTFVRKDIGGNSSAYNCLFLDALWKCNLYSCIATVAIDSESTDKDNKCLFSVPKASLKYDATTYRPLPGSVAIDADMIDYHDTATNGWTGVKAWWQTFFTGTDYAGGARRLGAAIDVGAGEADPDARLLTITDAQTALTVTGAEKGDTVLGEGESRAFTIARNYSTTKLCTGISVNGEFFSFTGETDDRVYERTYGYGDPVTNLVITAVYAEKNDWYVNANADPEKGLVGSDANDGYTKYRAKKTLAGAMAIKGLASGDTVHAAAGVYNEGGMYHSSYGSNRVNVASGVVLVGDEGASRTTIEGKISELDGVKDGCGADSMRAVYLNSGAVVKGFTITKGRTKPGLGDNNGGGAGVSGGLAVDCVFTNNVATGRGNVAVGATLLRCYIGANGGTTYGLAWDGYSVTKLIDCVQNNDRQYYSACTAYNTTFLKGTLRGTSAHNCIFLASPNTDTTYYSCIFTVAQGSIKAGDDYNQFSVATADLPYDPKTCRPLPGSKAIDKGQNSYYALATNKWSALWQSFVTGTDYAGGQRVLGASIDVGAGEYDPESCILTVTDAQTALVVEGAAKGVTVLNEGETNTFTVSRNYSTAKLLTGVNVNGTFYSFTGEDADKSYEFTCGYGDANKNFSVEAVYAEHNDWYVNANTDPAQGFVGSDAYGGYTKYAPKKTLAGALGNALVASGDVVHAAPGVYNEGTMAGSSTSTLTNRVIVKAGVGLVADEGRDVTAIEGFIPEKAKWGTTDPIRGVSMGSGAYLKGFTVRNAMASMEQKAGSCYGNTGGGVSGGTAIDCVITNCLAVRGGGAGGGAVLIRCYLANNNFYSATNPQGGSTVPTASGGYYTGSIYDSVVLGGVTAPGKVVNSYVSDLTHNDSDGRVLVYNSYVSSDGGRLILTNSVVSGKSGKDSTYGAGSRSNTPLKFDANWRPDRTDANTALYAIDRGDNAYYAYPAAFASESRDYAGGQRVYNGAIDIGPGEYDWRGDFAKVLRRKAVSVDEMDPGVTTNGVATALVLSGGDTLVLTLTAKAAGPCSLTVVAADATATVTANGAAVTPDANGVCTFQGREGENSVTVTCAGEGTVTVSDVKLAKSGIILLVR